MSADAMVIVGIVIGALFGHAIGTALGDWWSTRPSQEDRWRKK